MPTTIHDAKYWYDRAAEMRALSETNDIETRAIMLQSPTITTSSPTDHLGVSALQRA